MRLTAAAGLLTAGLLLSGCGGGSHHAQVASLPTHVGGSLHSTASALSGASAGIPDPDGRPRAPLNLTSAEDGALYGPYYACLRAHRYIDQLSESSQLAVVGKCVTLNPLPPWPLDPANPQARAFVGRVVTCLIAKGYHATAELVSTPNFAAPQWDVGYASRTVQIEHRTESAQSACQEQALR